jgi:hypothetical protein
MGNPFKALGKLFGWIGKKMAVVLHLVATLITDEQVSLAMVFVREASTNIVGNTNRKEWVSGQLQQRFHLSESLANLITELALQAVKKQIAKGVDTLEDLLSDDDEAPPPA